MTRFKPIKIGSCRSGYEAIRIMHRKWRALCQLDKAQVAYGVACREGVCPQGARHELRVQVRPAAKCTVHQNTVIIFIIIIVKLSSLPYIKDCRRDNY
jgi:succinate dehydrogenase/fumarate reductase-like Fe-S protein